MVSEQELKRHLYVLILCGGGGKRLWPRSRKKTPKQFIDLFGAETIFQQTFKRAEKITTPDKIFVINSPEYVDDVLKQAQNALLRNVILEPQPKNTAPAMGVAAAHIEKKDPQAVIINLASDHVIFPDEVFVKDMIAAAKIAYLGKNIVTVGIRPAFPHAGLGYIKINKKATQKINGRSVYRVLNFTEKPQLKKAQEFLKSGDYFWNANLYTWKASTALAAFEQYKPKMARGIRKLQVAIGSPGEWQVCRQFYQEVEDISIDYAISEKAKNLVLVPASFSWDDIGDWEVVYQRAKKDNDGNVVIKHGENGGFIVFESKNNLIHFNNQLLALVGVNDLIVVDTNDALLICHRKEAEKVKQIVKKLKKEGRLEYL
jgi:mannose-1-phosphate guanylyltransferase